MADAGAGRRARARKRRRSSAGEAAMRRGIVGAV